MNGKDLLRAMQEIDSAYVAEAAESGPQKRRMPLWGWLTTAAACLVLIGSVGLVLSSGRRVSPIVTVPSGPTEDTIFSTDATEPPENTLPTQNLDTEEGVLVVEMGNVLVNENCAILSLDYELDLDEVFPLTWNKEDVEAYFGWDLQPESVKDITPKLERDAEDLRFQVYADANGDIQWDTVPISWSEPILPSVEYAHRRGFTLTASRLGIFYEDFSVFADAEMTRGLPDEDIQVTDIGGTGVIFGHINYGYGPYDSGTHEPTGYYDIYMAKFSVNGVEYRIIAHDLSLRDVVILTTDVIWHNTEGYRDYSVTD